MHDTARFFKVLADEARLQMLWLLFNERELCVCDVMKVLGITQSKASRHLRTMRHAGMVIDRKEGLWSYYQLRDVTDALAKQHVELLRKTLAQRPEAASLLRSLRAWLDDKQRQAGCPSPKSTGATSTRRAGREVTVVSAPTTKTHNRGRA